MRKTLANFLLSASDSCPEIFFLTGDLGFGVFDEFKLKYPNKYLNVGIAEAGMVGVAAGLSSKNFIPICYSIASFLIPRSYEQVRFFSGYNNKKIIYIGAGGGYTYGTSGATHHSLDDLGLAAGIPNIEVYAPTGPEKLIESLNFALKSNSSSYIQIGKFGEHDLNKIHAPNVHSKNAEVGFISYGILAKSIESIAEKTNIPFLGISNIKPIDPNLRKFVEKRQEIYLFEEQFENSPIYRILLELSAKLKFNLIRKGPLEEFEKTPLSRDSLLQKHILNQANFAKYATELGWVEN